MRIAKFFDEDSRPILISPHAVMVTVDEYNTVSIKDVGCPDDDQGSWIDIQGTIEEVETELNAALNGSEPTTFSSTVGSEVRERLPVARVETREEAANMDVSDEDFPPFVYIVEEDLFYKTMKIGGTIAPFLLPMVTESPLGSKITIKS